MFGHRNKGEAGIVAYANQSTLVCLREKAQEPGRIAEIVEDNMLQGGRGGGLSGAGMLSLDTSIWARGKDRGDRGSGAGRVRGGRGLLVLGFLEGFCVFLRKGW
jgi:hypothetical protein